MTKTIIPPPPIQPRLLKEARLSFSQESLWFLQQLDPENVAYNLNYLLKFTGGIDRHILEQALNELVRRHEPLRTIYPNRGGNPVQVIQAFKPISLPFVDYSRLPEDEQERTVCRYEFELGNQRFDLQKGPLVRYALLHTAPKVDYLFFSTHHIGFDAWSRQIFFSELIKFYDAYQRGKEPELPELLIQFADYATWQREWLSGETLKTYVEHWKEILSGELPILELPTDRPRPAMQSYRGARHHFRLSPVLDSQIKAFCLSEDMKPFQFFLAAYVLLLMRYTGQEDIIVGCPFANRSQSELDGIAGLFVNTLPIRIKVQGNPSLRVFLEQVRMAMVEAYPWQAAPFEALVSELSPERDLSRTPVFQALINMKNVPKRMSSIEGLEMKNISLEDVAATFDISLELEDEEDHFTAALRYNTGLFDETTILHMVSHFQNILTAILDEPESLVSEFEIISPSERQHMILDWNETQVDLPQQSIQNLISTQVRNNPDVPAVICNGRQLSYSALEQQANHLSADLVNHGVRPGTLVGIFLPRSEDLVVSQLAILKSGGAYLPLDLTYPAERLAYMLKDANPAIIITRSTLSSQLPDQFQVVCLDVEEDAIRACPCRDSGIITDSEAIAYVTYTSGSTGRPKGVVTIQRGVLNYLYHLVNTYHLQAGERVIQFTPLSFDAAFRDTLGVLTFGGTVILLDDDQMRDPDAIVSAIHDNHVNCILSVVPTMLRAIAKPSGERKVGINHLRLVMPSGEVLQAADIDLVRNAFGDAVQIVNQYGPTECSMISTLYEVPKDNKHEYPSIAIGRPIGNVRIYILDRFGHPVPARVKGEIYIGGIGVGHGYLNYPDLTIERFLPDPFHSGGMMYRTGDMASYSCDGILSFWGRLDQQVKVRGYRVELGEIESVVKEFLGIKDVAVVLWNQYGLDTLAAYITISEGYHEPILEHLHVYLADRLPFYMLPSTVTVMEKMPLTPNRKIDRLALPRPERVEEPEHYLAPRNDVETRLISIWEEVLGLTKIGVRDNFFELGGHSLMAMRLFSRIQDEFGKSLPLILLFKNGTVEVLAESLTQDANSPIRRESTQPTSSRADLAKSKKDRVATHD